MRVWGVVVAAGGGNRFGGAKQYERLGGRRVLDWAVSAARTTCDRIVVVVPADRAEQPEADADVVVAGGSTRSASVRAGLAAVPAEAAVIVVHDAARPLAAPALFQRVLEAVASGADAAVPGVALADTVKRVEAGVVTGTLDRAELVAVQTPQAFLAPVLRRAHESGAEATDDAGLVEAVGGKVVVVPGDPRNQKLTNRDDLLAAQSFLSAASGAPSASPRTTRVGLGFDVHPFGDDPERVLVLGGVRLDHSRALKGHSDADVVAHAAAEALLGSAGLGDLGQHFSDEDPSWAGADSLKILARVADLLAAAGWRPVNVDCSVVLEAPKLAPVRTEMEGKLSSAVGAPVSVKARRAEGLGTIGRGEGVACLAVALIEAT